MGDYNVQIISARVKNPDKKSSEDFKEEVESRLPKIDSAYHSTSPFISVSDNFGDSLTLSMIVQAKYNRGVDEFIKWLKPMVIGGMGAADVWSLNFNEYDRGPKIICLREDDL